MSVSHDAEPLPEFSTIRPDVQIKADSPLGIVSEKFLSVAVDSGFLRKRSNLNYLNNTKFLNMVKALSPAIFRVGGTNADLLVFNEECKAADTVTTARRFTVLSNDVKELDHGLPIFYLCGEDWKFLNKLVVESGMTLLFDLNVLLRTPTGDWDPNNAQKLIKFSQECNFNIDWQLGNEPNSLFHVFGIQITPEQLAKDFKSLSFLLSKYPLYNTSKLVGPDITAPRKSKELELPPLTYLDTFLSQSKEVISAVTWHQYYVNGKNATKEDFMDFSTLNILAQEIKAVRLVVEKHTEYNFPVWISETSSAWGGGAPGLSDHFVSTFMWLDKLGLAARLNISVVIRQSLVGNGHYNLIDFKTMEPKPDFWISLVYKMTVGRIPLSLTLKKKKPVVRLYAHCPRKWQNMSSNNTLVVFGMNLGNSSFNASISTSQTLDLETYSFTPPEGNVLSKNILLNGKLLKLSRFGDIPSIKPKKSKGQHLHFPPHSLAFFVVRGIAAPSCV